MNVIIRKVLFYKLGYDMTFGDIDRKINVDNL
jgi:hypothetical protein